MRTTTFKGIAFALIAATFWGVSGTLAQFLFQQRGVSVEWLITIRMLVSGVLLLTFARFGEKTNVFQIWKDRKDAVQLLIFSITGMLAVQYTYFAAIKHSNAATATVLQYAGPILIAIYLAIRYRRAPRPTETLALFLAVIGVFLLVTHGDFGTLAISRPALFLGLAAAVALAVYTLQPIPLLRNHRPSIVIGWGMFCGALAFSFVHAPWQVQGLWDAQTYIYTGLIILFGTAIAFTLYLYAVKYIGGQRSSLLASAEPLSAALMAVLWLRTPFTWMDWIGSLCIISTVFLLSKRD